MFKPLMAVSLITCLAAPLLAQSPASKKKEALKPRLEKLVTADGVQLACGYFPSDKEKEAVPVILIHHWEGAAPPFLPLVQALRKAGCAVATPDLRGHGGSKTYVDFRGNPKEFDLSRMNRNDIMAMLNRDIEAVKKFLKQENDAGKLNLNALTLIGVGEGAVLAANYAVIDWNFPDLSRKKQSKDVRGLVLISPARNLKGLSYDTAARHPFVSRLPWLIVAGEGSLEIEEAEKLEKQLERVRRGGAVAGPVQLLTPRSQASNVELVRGSREVIPGIVDFVTKTVIAHQANYPWIDRSGD